MKEIFLPFIISLIAGLSTLIGYLFIYIKPSKTSDFIGTSLAFSMTIMMIISITDLNMQVSKYKSLYIHE